MKQIFTYTICLLFLSSIQLYGQNKPLVQYNLQELQTLKKSLDSKSAGAETQKQYRKLLKKADKVLAKDNPTVINKELIPPTKDKNDYLSISRYWWPDETKKKGLPWIRKDGDTNPDTQTDAVDRKRLGRFANYMNTLGLAYFFSKDDRYAKKAASMAKTWFINPRTRMNPHLKFAQSVPGNPKSRRAGILDGRDIPVMVLDGITFIQTSKYWTADDQLKLDQWFRDYMVWLAYSPTGKKGAQQENNHGTWYYYQVAALSYYNRDVTLVKKTISKTLEMFDSQINEEGGQLHELKRTRSFFYSIFNLDAYTRIAIIAEKAGIPFWDYKSEDNEKGLEKAIDFLIPVVNGAEWKYPTKKKDSYINLASVLMRVRGKIDKPEYEAALQKIVDEVSAVPERNSKQKKIFRDYNFANQGLFK